MSRLGVLHSDEELTGTDEIVDESLPELRQLRMIPCTIMYHLDDFMNRGAEGEWIIKYPSTLA